MDHYSPEEMEAIKRMDERIEFYLRFVIALLILLFIVSVAGS